MNKDLGTESKIGIICATARELAPYLSVMQIRKTDECAMHSFHNGTIKDICTTAVYSGCGKINASIMAQLLIDRYMEPIHPDALCIDMETAAVAHACYLNGVPFIAVRSISDNDKEAGQEASAQSQAELLPLYLLYTGKLFVFFTRIRYNKRHGHNKK